MRILFFGDVVGRSGREAVLRDLPDIRAKLSPDFVILNGENAAAGFGITSKICQDFFKSGVDVITLGNHAWDQKEIITYIQNESRLIRPLNYPKGTPGRGTYTYNVPGKGKILVIQAMGRLFMDTLDDPFHGIEEILSHHVLGKTVQAIFVDFHADATSEKMAFAYFLDGRVSGVFGTHTHVPTADAQILEKGTAYQTDVGMCGDYRSVIGMKKESPILRFLKKIPTERLSPAEGIGTTCAIFLETNDQTGYAKHISSLRIGPHIPSIWPTF